MNNKNVSFVSILLLLFVIGLGMSSLMNITRVKESLNQEQDLIEVNIENGMIMEMTATGYAIGPPYNSITRSGHPVINLGYFKIGDENIFTVAADPNVLPMGSLIYIVGLGIGMVQDTGTAIKGMRIDICFTTMDEAMEFGRQKVKVIVLRRNLDE